MRTVVSDVPLGSEHGNGLISRDGVTVTTPLGSPVYVLTLEVGVIPSFFSGKGDLIVISSGPRGPTNGGVSSLLHRERGR